MSVDQLAAATRINRATIYRVEGGEFAAPSAAVLSRIARALGTEVESYLALAGYYSLPELPTYLRAKYGVGPQVAQDVADYLAFRRQKAQDDDQAA